MKDESKTPIELTELSASDLRKIAKQFRQYAESYEKAAESVDEIGESARLAIKGIPTLTHAMKRISGSIQSVTLALLAEQFKDYQEEKLTKKEKAKKDVAAAEETIKKRGKRKDG
jgi:CHASE3 domain sensor protein